MIDPTALANSLAVAVVKGFLPMHRAEAAIAATIGTAWRKGDLQDIPDPTVLIHSGCFVLERKVEELESRREMVMEAMIAMAEPLIEAQTPIRRIRAELHDINGEAGFPLLEAEVEQGIISLLHEAKDQAELLAEQLAEVDARAEPPKRRRRRNPWSRNAPPLRLREVDS